MLNGKFIDLIWEKGDSTIIQTGDRKPPKNPIAGGFGTYRVSIPAEVILIIETERGSMACNIIKAIRSVTGRQKMSEKFIDNIRNVMRDEVFEINDIGAITNLRDILEKV